ncbi:MAG: GGDEF domain-containing protein [Thermodesulfobacteriota bacterium]
MRIIQYWGISRHLSTSGGSYYVVPRLFDGGRTKGRIEELDATDTLTELYTMTYFNSKLEDEYQYALRYKNPLSLSLLNVDHLKEVNDSLGRRAVDAYLTALANLIIKTIRKVDIAARYRGEEIAIIMPHTEGEHAVVQAERIREKVSTLEVPFEEHIIRRTISIGVASLNLDAGMTEEGLIGTAGKALKEAIAEGQNRVVFKRG